MSSTTNNSRVKLSFISGLYNSSNVVEEKLDTIFKGLSDRFGTDFEIILIENGSTDNTRDILQIINNSSKYKGFLRTCSLPDRGIGLAYKKGISISLGEHVLLSAIDLPFGFSDIDQVLQEMNRDNGDKKGDAGIYTDIIFFSKTHRDSVFPRSKRRKLTSFIYNSLLRILFNVNINDTQGSVLTRRKCVDSIISYLTSDSLFFNGQLAIYSKLLKKETNVLPVKSSEAGSTYNSKSKSKSSFSIIKDGLSVFLEMCSNYISLLRR